MCGLNTDSLIATCVSKYRGMAKSQVCCVVFLVDVRRGGEAVYQRREAALAVSVRQEMECL